MSDASRILAAILHYESQARRADESDHVCARSVASAVVSRSAVLGWHRGCRHLSLGESADRP